jgi:AraC family transcriptional regulator, positive regulator of tynA and feaB
MDQAMCPHFDFTNSQWTYEEWADALREYPWGTPKVLQPKTFTHFRCHVSMYGFELGAIKHDSDPGHAYTVRREYEDIRVDKVDHYHVLFQQTGTATVVQKDHALELAAGDIALVDAGRPSVFVNNGGIQYHLVLPRQPLVAHVRLDLHGGRRSHPRLFAERALRQLISDTDAGRDLSKWAKDQMQRVIYELVAVLFEPTFDPSPVPDAVFKRVCDIIRDCHADPNLTPSVVASEAGMSLRKLQFLFTSRGLTCTEYIQLVRLEHASFLIQRRELFQTKEPLSQISYTCGYRDHNYFCRVFQRKFGQSPGTYAKSHYNRP